MKAETSQWLAKAEADWATAGREAAVTIRPNHDAVCFHYQQCAEKYLKARLSESGLAFPKTHDLTALLHLLLPMHPDFERLRPALAHLTDFAVGHRYPEESATEDMAREAFEECHAVGAALRAAFGLS